MTTFRIASAAAIAMIAAFSVAPAASNAQQPCAPAAPACATPPPPPCCQVTPQPQPPAPQPHAAPVAPQPYAAPAGPQPYAAPVVPQPMPGTQVAPPQGPGVYGLPEGYEVYEYQLVPPQQLSVARQQAPYAQLEARLRRGRGAAFMAPIGAAMVATGALLFTYGYDYYDDGEYWLNGREIAGLTLISMGAVTMSASVFAMSISSLRTARMIRRAGGTVSIGSGIASTVLSLIPFGQVPGYFMALAQRRRNRRAVARLRARNPQPEPSYGASPGRVFIIAPPGVMPAR